MDNPTFFSSIPLLFQTNNRSLPSNFNGFTLGALFVSSQFYKLDDLNASGLKPNYAAESLEDVCRNSSTIICK
jgi:hypothetical protein